MTRREAVENWHIASGRSPGDALMLAQHELKHMPSSPCDEMLYLLGVGIIGQCSRVQSVSVECLEIVFRSQVYTVSLDGDGSYTVRSSAGYMRARPTMLRTAMKAMAGA